MSRPPLPRSDDPCEGRLSPDGYPQALVTQRRARWPVATGRHMKRGPLLGEQSTVSAPDDQKVVPFPAAGARRPQSGMGMSDKLDALFCRLTTRQRNLIFAAAETDRPTPHSVIRQIAELESAIAAVATLWDEDRETRR